MALSLSPYLLSSLSSLSPLTLALFLPISFSLSFSPSPSSLSFAVYTSIFLSLFLSFSCSLSLSSPPSLYTSLYLSIFIFHSIPLFLFLSQFLYPSNSHFLSLYACLSPYLSLSLALSLSMRNTDLLNSVCEVAIPPVMGCLSHFTTIHSNVGIMLLIIIIAAAILCKYIVLYSQANFDNYNFVIFYVLDDVKTASGMIVSNPAAFGNSWAAPTDFGTVRLFSELC